MVSKSMELYEVISESATAVGVRVGKSEASLGMYYLTHLSTQERNRNPCVAVNQHEGMSAANLTSA